METETQRLVRRRAQCVLQSDGCSASRALSQPTAMARRWACDACGQAPLRARPAQAGEETPAFSELLKEPRIGVASCPLVRQSPQGTAVCSLYFLQWTRGTCPCARHGVTLPWAPEDPGSARGGGRMWSCSPGRRRALTADHAPAQLPDALLTGFFPLKFTPSLSAQGGWVLAPR